MSSLRMRDKKVETPTSSRSPFEFLSGLLRKRDRPGQYLGHHYSSYLSRVEILIATNRFEEAVDLLLDLIDAMEAEARATDTPLMPKLFVQLATLYKAQGLLYSELFLLERYMREPHVEHLWIAARLQQIRHELMTSSGEVVPG